MTPALEARGVTRRTGGATLVADVDLRVARGEVLGLVGPNGAGKSTLLAMLAGDLAPSAGEVLIDGAPVGGHSARALARRRAVLSQQTLVRFAFTAREVVEMGRAPHIGRLGRPGDADRRAVDRQMERVEVDGLAGRTVTTLSGGEAARVSLARVLAQEAPVVLLDEPTAALDLRHQEVVMRTARALADDDGAAVVMVLHDLNLAAAHCDRIGMMGGGRMVVCAPPWEALTPARVGALFAQDVLVTRHPARDRPMVVARPGPARPAATPPPPPA